MHDHYDWLIRGATIVDGSGAARMTGDVGITGDRIAKIGDLKNARSAHEVEAGGRVLAPGFVDAHLHTDLDLLAHPAQEASLAQGVTAHVIGQDGVSYAPASPETQRYFLDYFAAINGDPSPLKNWPSVKAYLAAIDGAGVNAAFLIPHGTVRYGFLRSEDRPPTAAELAGMQQVVAQGMADGAVGISSGLEYLPGAYAATDELVAVCEPAGRAGGVYVTHMRSYHADRVEAAFHETVEIGRRARLPVHISHYNGKADQLGRLIDQARAAGDDVTFETYPYLAGCTILGMAGLPKSVQTGGLEATMQRLARPEVRFQLRDWFAAPDYPWEAFHITYAESAEDRRWEGIRIPDAARRAGQTIGDFVCDLLIRTRFRVACIVHHVTRTEDDVIRLMQKPEHMGGSDGVYTGSRPHPRGYGTFARYLEYVRDKRVLGIEAMVHHLSDRPCRRFGFAGRGRITPGAFADLILFDLAHIQAESTYENGAQLARGMDWVWVNGVAAIAEGKFTGKRGGRSVKKKPQFRP